jgi:hypothetical protein
MSYLNIIHLSVVHVFTYANCQILNFKSFSDIESTSEL